MSFFFFFSWGHESVLLYQEFPNLWAAHTSEDCMSLGRADGVVLRIWTETGTEPLDPLFTQLHIGKGQGRRNRPGRV